MNQTAFNVIVQAINQLQEIGSGLYDASEVVSGQGDITDALLLQGIADKIYEEADDIDVLLSEMEV